MKPPSGELRTVWRVDANRYRDDPNYRERVAAFIRRHIIGGSPDDAEVLADDADHHVLTAITMFDRDGDFRRGAGGIRSTRVVVPLDPKEKLP